MTTEQDWRLETVRQVLRGRVIAKPGSKNGEGEEQAQGNERDRLAIREP